MDSLRGQLLVAAPNLVDPNFRRTVVLIAEHDEEGALGLVLNRRLELAVADVVPELDPLAPNGRVHAGGPVRPSGALILAEFEEPGAAGLLVVGSVGLPAADMEVDDLVGAASRARVFAGHGGWGPGQLDTELEADGWIVLPAEPDDVFTADSEGLWATVLERQGGEYALLARMPADPRMN
ncbi:MAG TPA: YqgE/AlgH family protein [Thermoleophilaceae bacterium]|nr:YqgE/AlgH family protein [Thermoleophilaceae bacterium]